MKSINELKNKCGIKGFTLVELLVVISIIALLLAILMPALQKVREQGKSMVCMSNTKTIGLAFTMYTTENKGRLPHLVDMDDNVMAQRWYGLIFPYCSQKMTGKKMEAKFFVCPSRREKIISGTGGTGNQIKALDYGVNYAGPYEKGLINYIESKKQWKDWYGSRNVAEVRNPSEIFLAMDILPVESSTGAFGCSYFVLAPYTLTSPNGGSNAFDDDKDGDGENDTCLRIYNAHRNKRPYNGSAHRHNKRINVIFVDGHSSNLRTGEWTKRNHWTW